MTKIDPQSLTRDKREVLLHWLTSEGLVPREIIADDRFSVHGGYVSGNRYLFDENGKIVFRDGDAVRVFFRSKQKNPLPLELL